MNYLEQIKGFWIAQEAHQLSTSEIALYFYLLEICNKTGWIDTIYRNNYKVMADLSIKSYKTLQGIRDRLRNAGVLEYYQKNGEANVGYELNDLGKNYLGAGDQLGKNYQGKGKGSVKGKGKGSVKGPVEEKINQTKNQTKHSDSNESAPAASSEFEKVMAYWKIFVSAWDKFYLDKTGSKYRYQKKDWGCLKKIYDFLKKRSEEKQYDWNEKNMVDGFNFFLQKAYDKDDWMRNNFSCPNLLSQFNQIANEKRVTDNRKGAAPVSTKSAFDKIDAMSGKA